MNGPEQCLPGPPPRRKSYGMYFKLNNIPTQTAHRHRDVQRSGLVDEATTASRCPVVAIGLRTAAVAVNDPAGRRHPERSVEVVTVALAVERSVGVRLDIETSSGLDASIMPCTRPNLPGSRKSARASVLDCYNFP